MSELSNYKIEYEDMAFKTPQTVGRKKIMAKSTKEVPTAKTRKAYNKSRGEHFKDVVIAVLIAGIVAFIAGMQFANSNQAKVDAAVETARTAEAVDAPVKK